jgi:hypothetical protein
MHGDQQMRRATESSRFNAIVSGVSVAAVRQLERMARLPVLGIVPVLLVAVLLAPGSARASAQISFGTYVDMSYNNGGTGPGSTGSYPIVQEINYLNGTLQSAPTQALVDTSNGNLVAYASANLYPAQLTLQLGGDGTATTVGTTSALAETWDNLNFNLRGANLTGVAPSTVMGYLTLTVTATAAPSPLTSTGSPAATLTAYGVALYNTATFFPVLTGGDCGGAVLVVCQGVIGPGGSAGGGIALNGVIEPISGFPALVTGQVQVKAPITLAQMQAATSGISYIAEIAGSTTAANDLGNLPLNIDPSITLTGLYPGITVSTASGASYSPVPLPATAWLFGSGLIGMVAVTRRRRGVPAA